MGMIMLSYEHGNVLIGRTAIHQSEWGSILTSCWDIPSGKCLQFAMENHHFSWEISLFQWWFSIVMLNYQRVMGYHYGYISADCKWFPKNS